jgi:hypothetical protein
MDLVIEFPINTSIKRFEDWLDRYRLSTLPMILDLEGEKSLHVASKPTLNSDHLGLRKHQIRARISTPDPNKDDTAILSFPFPVIEFEIEEPSENRLMINIWCKHTALTPYYSDMFDEIAKRWPEAETAIRNQLTDEVKEQSEQAGDKIKNEYSADREQSEELIESIIKLPFADAKDELEKFIWQCELQGRLSLPRGILDLPEGYGYEINHKVFGNLGQLSIHPREGKQTRIRITKPYLPTPDEAVTAAGKAGFDVLHINAEDWLFENREVENSKFRKSVFEYMARAEAEYSNGVSISPESDNDLGVFGGPYGTCRDMTIDEVRSIVKRCRTFTQRGGKVPEFYRRQNVVQGAPKSYELETLRGWLKNPKFSPEDT